MMLFTGRITADAVVRAVGDSKKVTGFTVAINDRFTAKGEKREVTSFVECSYWVNPGLAMYLTKGAVVEIFGRVEAKAWLNKENKPQPYLTCNVSEIRLFGAAQPKDLMKSGKPKDGAKAKVAATSGANASGHDDLPF
ncbi:single-stranded DNA-binding protein [Mucilaginibacter sp. P25]|uniref:single-stranded DNA-binding protein n=1 Tax=Mucilaginibacter sp. P25 TaxID=3423945 RepID=UPI003D7B92F7